MSDALGKQGWDVIFCDHARPEFDSSSALKLLHEIGLDLPFIIVSGATGEDISVVAMESGAHDFLLKRNRHRLGGGRRAGDSGGWGTTEKQRGNRGRPGPPPGA